jgi:histidine ammonia-lyase
LKKSFYYGIDHLTASMALDIAHGQIQGIISDQAKDQVTQSSQAVADIVQDGAVVYGINTGFGPLCTTKISASESQMLQTNILMSHAVGVGSPIDPILSKLMLILKLHALAQGYSGISLKTLERIQWYIEKDAIPEVPEQGSVGASGDLAPLAHLFLPLIGEGFIHYKNKRMSGADFCATTGLTPLRLGPKEGLALINGTQFIAAHGVKLLRDFHNCLVHADLIAALMVEALQGSIKPFHPKLHQLRPFKGVIHVAHKMYTLLKDSPIMKDHEACEKVQDPYSLRCVPQVHGASRNAWLHLKELLEIELNAVTDNPVIIDKNLSISGGNFHGQPLAMALDYACLALSELGSIADRRIYLALEGGSPGVPKLLMAESGINSGYMILQYTTAALASENKGLCFPASADSIPTSMGQEDHVSMGSIGGRKALQVAKNLEKIQAIELLTACQALTFRRPMPSGALLDSLYQKLRSRVSFAAVDRVFAPDIAAAQALLASGEFQQTLAKALKNKHPDFASAYESLFENY